MSEAKAKRRALNLNVPRRHLTPEEQAEAAGERRDEVATGTAAGKSTRTMAKELGVSQSQIVNDQAAGGRSGEQGCSPDKVTGADGKQYPPPAAKKPPPKARKRKSGAQERFDAISLLAKFMRRFLKKEDNSLEVRQLAAVAAGHGVPLVGRTWPAFDYERVSLVFRDLARGMVSA
jgi:transposase